MRSLANAALLLAAAVATCNAQTPGDHVAAPQRALLPDTGGPIASAVISVNSARRAALRNANLVTDIVNGLPAPVRFAILANDRAAFTMARNPWPERIRFVDMPAGNAMTIWTQDPFLVLHEENDGSITLLASKTFERAGDRLMAERIAQDGGYELETSTLYFEGGNIVSDTENVFIGADTIRYNATEDGTSEVDVVREFQAVLGRRVLVVGPFPQPIAHIDMMLTPIGEGIVVLADAAAGARIAADALEREPESVAAFERYTEEYFFGHPSLETIAAADGSRLEAPEMTGQTAEMIEESRRIAPTLDGIAASLADFGYTVERVPFLFGGPDPDPEQDGGIRAGYPMLTYNNVLVETTGEARNVYLPRFGWEALDEAAARAWAGLGFDVQQIDGLTISAMYGGALRCSVKVLARTAD